MLLAFVGLSVAAALGIGGPALIFYVGAYAEGWSLNWIGLIAAGQLLASLLVLAIMLWRPSASRRSG
ncbi:hypothetical protein [Actinomadura sp. DC4]|uniref:hypothetical protein n=1 Tax=Actinomadura sp. DC4 TaxID=3055069 RepID=UPI0025AF1C7A|nr:hypothetical protein [Actinomadura sp. DC4]MDN3353450.1 hypothetical protein [Actinomadura sp. DC4]